MKNVKRATWGEMKRVYAEADKMQNKLTVHYDGDVEGLAHKIKTKGGEPQST